MALGINQMLQSMSYFIAGPVQKHRQWLKESTSSQVRARCEVKIVKLASHSARKLLNSKQKITWIETVHCTQDISTVLLGWLNIDTCVQGQQSGVGARATTFFTFTIQTVLEHAAACLVRVFLPGGHYILHLNIFKYTLDIFALAFAWAARPSFALITVIGVQAPSFKPLPGIGLRMFQAF